MSSKVPFISYDDMAQVAKDFVDQNNGSHIPVDIELLIEKSGFEIVPIPHLKRNFDIDGFLSSDFIHIYVDEKQYMHNLSQRFRFTLAHELAHALLHKDLLTQLQVEFPQDSGGGTRGLSHPEYNELERQANMVAGMILVPETDLIRSVNSIKSALPNGLTYDEQISAAASILHKRYKVSHQVVQIRIEKEELL